MKRAVLVVALLFSGCVGADDAAPPAPETEPRAWPDPEEATIRPGVQFGRLGLTQAASDQGGCTANFVFEAIEGPALYIGTAAHCVEGSELGDELWIAGREARVRLAYSSWLAMRESGEGEPSASDPHPNDFALLEIAEADHPRVHPALLGWGGPTGLAESAALVEGDGLLAYGNSSFKPPYEGVRALRGALVSHEGEFAADARFDVPMLPADSGSPVLTEDARAFAVVVTLRSDASGENGLAKLDALLAYALEHGAPAVRLATAPSGTTSAAS